jgi:hypothetical protein
MQSISQSRRWLVALMGPVLCAAVLVAPITVHAATTIYVPANYPTIQAAIGAAANGDTVVVSPGTYNELINFNGKAITVQSAKGPGPTIIDGGSRGVVVTFSTSEGRGSVLQGFTIQHGAGQYFGGGIYIAAASPTITGNVITNNAAATGGGGIYGSSASPLIQGNTITNNSQIAGWSGGGGGGIALGSWNSPLSAQISGNTISGNSFSSGGGLQLNAVGTPTIQNNIIQNNVALSQGGGLYVINQSDANIVQNLVTGNRATDGAGMYVLTPSGTRGPWLTNNTLASNSATGSASGIYASGFFSQSKYFNNVVVGASGQTALVCDLTYSTVQPVFDHNDLFSPAATPVTGCIGVVGANGNISVDPLFVSASDFRLQSGSPSINTGNNAAPNLPTTDLAGNPRISGGVVDQGAYEFQTATAPGPVQNLTGQWVSATSATISWTAPASNGGTAITSYSATQSPGGVTQTVGAATTSATFTGLNNSTAYTLTVVATNAVGNGPSSSVTLNTVPGPVQNLTGRWVTTTSASVSWTAPASNGGTAITSYAVTQSPGGISQTVGSTTTSATFTGLNNSMAYTFTVVATNAVGNGPSTSVTLNTVPGAVRNLNAQWLNGNSAGVSWVAPASNGGSPITSYTVTQSGGVSQTVGPTVTSVTFTNLDNGSNYTFTVVANNSVGSGPPSSVTLHGQD